MSKILVAYFSCSGVSKNVAKLLSEELNANLYEIKPQIPYTDADLDWTNNNSRSTKEMKNRKQRPAISDKNAGIENYNIILLSFPIWWSVAPTIVNTFLEAYDFKGKKIILFATSSGGGFGETLKNLKGSVDESTLIEEAKVFHGRVTQSEFGKFIKNFKI